MGISDIERNVRAWAEIRAGNKLLDDAKALTGHSRKKKFAESYSKYAEAVRINPDMNEAFDNWGGALLTETKALSGVDRGKKLAEAGEKLVQAKQFGGKPLYNMACLLAHRGKIDAALDELEECRVDGTLPGRDHLEADTDMDPLRDHPRFKALLDSL